MSYQVFKRFIDLFLSVIGLIILSPLLLILAIVIKIDSKGPVLFKQKRVGIYKTHFEIFKFRTMQIDTPRDTPTHILANPDQYITRVGKVLRKSSLDELPQILNIINGSMSQVGPRPALFRNKFCAPRSQVGPKPAVFKNGTLCTQINYRAKTSDNKIINK